MTGRWQDSLWAVGLIALALIHAAPITAVLGGDALQRLYGIAVQGPELTLLLRHRGVLFALVAGVMLLALFRPNYRDLALVTGWISVLSFLLLAAQSDPLNTELRRVVKADWVALGVLVVLSGLRLANRSETPVGD